MYGVSDQSMNDIIPAILPDTSEVLAEGLASLVGGPRFVQIDVCDGLFVTTRTWPLRPHDRIHFADVLKGEEGLPYWHEFNFEIDLMVHQPEKHVLNWVVAGVHRVVFHLKSQHNWNELHDAVGDIADIGLAVDLDPPYEKLALYVPRVDYIQVMGIAELGRQGSALDNRVFALIKRLKHDFPDVTLQVDGGVSEENARTLLDAGVDRLVVGSAIMRATSPKDAYRRFQNV